MLNEAKKSLKNPCKEALELCNLEKHDNIEYKTEVFTMLERPNLGKIISPVRLTRESFENIIKKVLNDEKKRKHANAEQQQNVNIPQLSGFVYSDDVTKKENFFQEILSELILQTTTLLHCEGKNSETDEPFYIFTLNESGYPRFILKPKSIRNQTFLKLSSILVAEDGASSSTYT